MAYLLDNDTIIPMIPREKPSIRVGILSEVKDYNHTLLNIPAVWRVTQGDGVKLVILDTGLPEHNDLEPVGSKSFIPGYLKDQCGHSTFVGGIVAARSDNGIGVSGICPKVQSYYGAVLDGNGTGSVESIIAGIRWAVDVVGADVINMSLGITASFKPGKELENVCNYAYNQGCILFASAGNDARAVNWPAAYDSVIAVAAVDKKMSLANFSSRGPEVEFAAGGVNVFSTYLNNGYATMSGTSFSCPAVAGVGCLIAAKFKAKGIRLSPEEIRGRLRKIAYDVGPEGKDDMFGYGIPIFTKEDQEAIAAAKSSSWLKRLFRRIKIW